MPRRQQPSKTPPRKPAATASTDSAITTAERLATHRDSLRSQQRFAWEQFETRISELDYSWHAAQVLREALLSEESGWHLWEFPKQPVTFADRGAPDPNAAITALRTTAAKFGLSVQIGEHARTHARVAFRLTARGKNLRPSPLREVAAAAGRVLPAR